MFEPPTPHGEGITIKLGTATFELPRNQLRAASASRMGTDYLELRLDNMWVVATVPERKPYGPHLARLTIRGLPPALAADEVSLRTAAYEARGQADDEVTVSPMFGRLDARIAGLARWIADPFADRIAIVRFATVKALLKINAPTPGDSLSGEFSYYSPDELTMGAMMFGGHGDREEQLATIRGLVGSFRLEVSGPESAVSAEREVLRAVAAIQAELSSNEPCTTGN